MFGPARLAYSTASSTAKSCRDLQAGREMAGKIEEMHGRIGDLRIENASYLQTLEEADVEITQLQVLEHLPLRHQRDDQPCLIHLRIVSLVA